MADSLARPDLQTALRYPFFRQIICSALCQLLCFERNTVHQIVNMQDIARRKDAGNPRLEMLVYDRPFGMRVHLNSRFQSQVIFRDQTNRKNQGIA